MLVSYLSRQLPYSSIIIIVFGLVHLRLGYLMMQFQLEVRMRWEVDSE